MIAIYARENGQGMAFPMPVEIAAGPAGAGESPASGARSAPLALTGPSGAAAAETSVPPEPPPGPPTRRKPSLKRVK